MALRDILPTKFKVQDWPEIRKEKEIRGITLHELVAIPDDLLERLGLGRPLTALVDLFYDLAPQGLLGETLGVPSPGDIAEEIKKEIRTRLKAAVTRG